MFKVATRSAVWKSPIGLQDEGSRLEKTCSEHVVEKKFEVGTHTVGVGSWTTLDCNVLVV